MFGEAIRAWKVTYTLDPFLSLATQRAVAIVVV